MMERMTRILLPLCLLWVIYLVAGVARLLVRNDAGCDVTQKQACSR